MQIALLVVSAGVTAASRLHGLSRIYTMCVLATSYMKSGMATLPKVTRSY